MDAGTMFVQEGTYVLRGRSSFCQTKAVGTETTATTQYSNYRTSPTSPLIPSRHLLCPALKTKLEDQGQLKRKDKVAGGCNRTRSPCTKVLVRRAAQRPVDCRRTATRTLLSNLDPTRCLLPPAGACSVGGPGPPSRRTQCNLGSTLQRRVQSNQQLWSGSRSRIRLCSPSRILADVQHAACGMHPEQQPLQSPT